MHDAKTEWNVILMITFKTEVMSLAFWNTVRILSLLCHSLKHICNIFLSQSKIRDLISISKHLWISLQVCFMQSSTG